MSSILGRASHTPSSLPNLLADGLQFATTGAHVHLIDAHVVPRSVLHALIAHGVGAVQTTIIFAAFHICLVIHARVEVPFLKFKL